MEKKRTENVAFDTHGEVPVRQHGSTVRKQVVPSSNLTRIIGLIMAYFMESALVQQVSW